MDKETNYPLIVKKQSTKELQSILDDYTERYSKLTIGDNRSYESTKKARTELVTFRTSLTKAGDATKKPHNEAIKKINAFVKSWVEKAAPLEAELQATVKNWEERVAREKAEAERKEKERIDAIHNRIAIFKSTVNGFNFKTSEQMKEIIDQVTDMEIDETFEEFQAEAMVEQEDTLRTLNTMYQSQLQAEKDKAELEEAKAELAKLRAEKAESDAEKGIQSEPVKEPELAPSLETEVNNEEPQIIDNQETRYQFPAAGFSARQSFNASLNRITRFLQSESIKTNNAELNDLHKTFIEHLLKLVERASDKADEISKAA